MRTKKNKVKFLGAMIAVLLATAPGAFALITTTIPIITIWYATVVELDFGSADSNVFIEHVPESTGIHNELHLVATATLSEFVVGARSPSATTAARANYHVVIKGALNPTAANLGHLKACQQAAMLALSNPAKFKLQLSSRSTTYFDVNDPSVDTQITAGTSAAYGAVPTNVRCSLIRR